MSPPASWTLLGAALLVVGGTAASAGPGQDRQSGSVTGCVDHRSGALRIIARSSRCTGDESKLVWNRRGPTGPRGVTGTPGAPGAPGATGSAGTPGVFDFDSFDGMPCTNGGPGTLTLTYDDDGYARFTC